MKLSLLVRLLFFSIFILGARSWVQNRCFPNTEEGTPLHVRRPPSHSTLSAHPSNCRACMGNIFMRSSDLR
ncbi:hypothetical protein B0H16DRAFT_1541970 [Mycena metata]|uniref:Secreted protein n=1 Tax=Mycena metata TaxID=1033252 RepID=A0AAD7NCD5_9AGAR|nr:hypothetical protein B0H16DRAFT_1541970 [Mycena metata]